MPLNASVLSTLLRSLRSRLGRRLSVRIVLVSAAITAAVTVAQLSWQYRTLKQDMQSTLDSAAIHVDSLSRSVWSFDEKQLQLTLHALLQLPFVRHVTVKTVGDSRERQWTMGDQIAPGNAATQTFALTATVRGQPTHIGDFTVTADLSELRTRILEQALTILLTNGIKTFVVSLFMLYLFHTLIGQRLMHLLPGKRLPPRASAAAGDELDWVAAALARAHQDYQDKNRELDDALAIRTAVLDSVPEAIVTMSSSGIIQSVNRAAGSLFGYTEDELLGTHVARLMGETDARRHDDYVKTYERTREGTVIGKGRQVSARHRNGDAIPVFLSVTELDHAGERRFVGVMRDLRGEQEAARQVHRLAFYDALTECPNRILLTERIEHAMDKLRRSEQFGALLFIDLDHFKAVNDMWGHAAGDELLRQTARRIRHHLRADDTLARFGGDEFVLLLEDLAESAEAAAQRAAAVAEKLLERLAVPFMHEGHAQKSGASIGICIIDPAQRATPDDLIRHADMAMYKAKAEGRGSFAMFEQSLQQAIQGRISLEHDLDLAIVRNEFSLYLQPQVSDQGRLVGCEGLIRWRHPQGRVVGPGEFIPIAEQSRLILEIGAWVIEEACRTLARWKNHASLGQTPISINVSVQQCHDPNFRHRLEDSAARHGIDRDKLIVEITESTFAERPEQLLTTVQWLRHQGFRFSLDDFGTGYSSLSYLGRLPLDELKIDQSFVRGLEADASSQILVQSIIGLARSLNLKVIAEGVETHAQRDLLQAYGCTRYQGYLFARPMPLAEFESHAWHQTATS